jgi:hypothetical protein
MQRLLLIHAMESIDAPWQLWHFHCLVWFTFAGLFCEAQWPANTKTSTDTTIRKRRSLSTCRLSFSLKKTLPTRPGSSVTPQAEATSWPPPPRRSPAPGAAGASLGVLKCTAVSVIATAWPQRQIPLRRTGRHLGPSPGPGLSFSPNFGLNGNSNGLLFGFTVWYEIEQFLIPKESGTPNSERACLIIAMRAEWRNLSPRPRPTFATFSAPQASKQCDNSSSP